MHDLNYCMPDLNYCMPDLNYCGITAELLRNYCGITVKQAELLYARKNTPCCAQPSTFTVSEISGAKCLENN